MRLQKNSNGGAGARVPVMTVADLLDGNEVAVEQSFNREQVQEQEQVCICVRFIPAIMICVHIRCATCVRMRIHSLLCCVYALVFTYTLYTMYIRVYVQYAVCM